MACKKFSDEIQLEMVEKYKKGTTKKDLSTFYKATVKTVNKILDSHGANEHATRYRQSTRQKAWDMALNGNSAVEISEELGVSIKFAQDCKYRVNSQNKQIIEDENLIKATPKERLHRVFANGISYTDITDFVAGI